VRPGGITTQGLRLDDLALSDIKSRFFMAGPTNIYSLLGSIDDRVSGINTQAQQRSPACLTQPPVAYVIHPFGQSVTLYAQCFQRVGSSNPRDPGFVQFGQKDGVTYYYSAIGAGWTAAVLTPTALASIPDDADAGVGAEAGAGVDAGAGAGVDAGADPDAGSSPEAAAAEAGAGPAAQTYLVRAWSGVGYLNATGCGNMTGFDDCSYGVIQLEANSSSVTFEMSVAGIGFGYCGAQLKSDGTNVYGIGSPDMGTTCGASDTFCVAASDVTTPATCGSAVKTLTLPALGRMSTTGPNAGGPGAAADSGASWAASQYPRGSSDGIVLDGTTSDSLYFGPTGPTAGVGEF
jgi:hypothetical protein